MSAFKWIAGLLILVLVFMAGLCSRTIPPKENTKALQELAKANQEKQKLLDNNELKDKLLQDCNAVNDTLIAKLNKQRPDIKKTYERITSKPLTDSELQREIAELYRKSTQ